jgi:hypothetical protein
MDALWGIAGKIPENGPQAANATTYLTIINAVRQNLLLDPPKGETADETAERRERGIVEGRRLWEGIVARWRNADLKIDEELVCGMGRLLLIGSRPRDWDDVLSLLEQTMDIPRLVPRLGTPGREAAGLRRIRAPNTPGHLRFDDDHLTPDKSPVRGDEFLALNPQGVGSAVSNPLSYATPGNNALSIAQEACQKLIANKAAQEYWELLTDPTTYDIVPDLNNLHMRLRNMRQDRASTAAVALLENDMVAKGVMPKPGTFRIAMSTCVRDKNNHNSLRNASQILKIMMQMCEDADSKAVGMYAELALNFPLATGSDLVDALTALTPIVKSIRLQLGVGGERRYGQDVGAMAALRKVYAVYDKLLLSNMLAEERKAPFKVERARLASFIQRITFKGQGGVRADEMDAVDEADLHGYLRPENEGEDGSNQKQRPRYGRDDRRGKQTWRKQSSRPETQRKPWSSESNLNARGMA